MNLPAWVLAGLAAALFSLLRYLLIAGPPFLLLWVWGKKRWARFRIQPKPPRGREPLREFLWSLSSMLVFGLVGISVYALQKSGWGRIYFDLDRHGRPYVFLSLVLMILAHDAYFYLTHRWMHGPAVFDRVHRIHHLSRNPSPLAAFSFHPLEAAVQGAILPLLVILLPLHPLAIFLFLVYTTVLNVSGHLGFEFLPKGFARHPVWGLSNTSVHHNMHHSEVNCNYSLYFNIWDKIMATNHPKYLATYDRVKSRTAGRRS